ncbi:MAG: phosphate acyltransferase PlsX [Fusobacteria bacterium]|nr:phosphate acyltransferase PlsX [Fusobacteriota bacterium]
MKIAVDAMGGDHFPSVPVEGAIRALQENSEIEVILVGDETVIKKELLKYEAENYDKNRISIKHTDEYIAMDESEPVSAVRKKKMASVNVALHMVKAHEAVACVSAGNTGAYMAASFMILGRVEGVLRPAITTIFPGKNRVSVLLDVGANADSKPEYLEQFALMGSVYAEIVLKKKNPKVGLLNIGVETTKGNELIVQAYELINKRSDINFVGNVEPGDLMFGDLDVMVSDGFTGNIALKTGEAMARLMKQLIREAIEKSTMAKLGYVLTMKSTFDEISKKMNPSEYGGAIFLGIDGVTIKAHGSSDVQALKNAIKVAHDMEKKKLVESLRERFSKKADII